MHAEALHLPYPNARAFWLSLALTLPSQAKLAHDLVSVKQSTQPSILNRVDMTSNMSEGVIV